ncbi:MAG TPA: glycosyltransferase family 4 protein [Vicinamibacterales bacterium]|jgi:glycosyltransferase involved in cell wall biosynthesis|nr:glycosyltransferase family 4 protein [Vicinamibacterales bacterium]
MTSVGTPARVTFVLTHPVQYQAPWLRYIAAHAPELELTVLYGALPTADQQGTGFGTAFEWDVPLTHGYRWEVCSSVARDFNSDAFFGIDVREIGERIAATSPDVVVVNGWHSAMQIRALRACREVHVPVLYRGDSTLSSGPRSFARPLWRMKTRMMLRQFDGYLSVGEHAAAYLRSFGIPSSLVTRSPHCVDNARFAAAAQSLWPRRQALRAAIGATDDDFVVLFAGKFQDRKRPLDAVRSVARLGQGAMLMTAGDGPLASDAREAAARLGVRLAWRGFMNQSALPEAFVAADCLIVPSEWETWGLIVNEALASGLPCVVTEGVAAAADLVVDAVTGYTTAVGDIDGMVRALSAVRATGRGRFSPACRQQVEQCSFAEATRGLLAAVEGLMSTHASRVAVGSHVA